MLLAGFRAAGWTCAGTLVLAILIALVGLRGIGLVGQQRICQPEKPVLDDVEMVLRGQDSAIVLGEPSAVATLTAEEVQ